MQAIWLLFLCLTNIACYPPCSVIQFADYSFDLTGLKNATIIYNTNYAQIWPCQPKACNSNNDSQKSFIQIGGGSMNCTPHTINTTIIQNFAYINPQSPKDGIAISYLPYVSTSTKDNEVIQTTYSSQLNVYCQTTAYVQQACTYSTGTPNTITLENGTKLTKAQNAILCQFSSINGCPYLTINSYWQFLSNNSIWFAIVLWVFSIFELFMGYFVIRLTIFLYGILTGAVFGIIFSAQSYVNFFYDDTGSGIIVFVILLSFLMGILFGLFLLTLPRLGYVNIGMWDAIIFSLLLQNSVLYLTGSMLGFYITLGVSCLIMLAISLLRFRKFIILSTPFISAFWIIRTLGFVLPYYPNEFASEKLFAINASTPWQFYLYLASILILSILGCTFQFCWYKKKGRDHGNKGYYLEDDDNIKDKLKKFLQFNDIKNFINAGKQEMLFLKKLVTDRDSEQQLSNQQSNERKPQIEMVKMTKLKQVKERSNVVAKKNKINNESQIEHNKKLKKVDSSDSDGRGQDKKIVKISKQKQSSNIGTKLRDKNSDKSSGDRNVSQDSSEEQEYARKVEVKGKKNRT